MTLWMTLLDAQNKLFWCLLWRTRLARYCFDTQIFFAKLWFSIFSSNPPSSPAKRSTLLTISWLEGWLVAGACFEGPGEQGTRSGGIWGERIATRWSGDVAATEIQRILFYSGKTLFMSKYFPTTPHCALFVNWFKKQISWNCTSVTFSSKFSGIWMIFPNGLIPSTNRILNFPSFSSQDQVFPTDRECPSCQFFPPTRFPQSLSAMFSSLALEDTCM